MKRAWPRKRYGAALLHQQKPCLLASWAAPSQPEPACGKCAGPRLLVFAYFAGHVLVPSDVAAEAEPLPECWVHREMLGDHVKLVLSTSCFTLKLLPAGENPNGPPRRVVFVPSAVDGAAADSSRPSVDAELGSLTSPLPSLPATPLSPDLSTSCQPRPCIRKGDEET